MDSKKHRVIYRNKMYWTKKKKKRHHRHSRREDSGKYLQSFIKGRVYKRV